MCRWKRFKPLRVMRISAKTVILTLEARIWNTPDSVLKTWFRLFFVTESVTMHPKRSKARSYPKQKNKAKSPETLGFQAIRHRPIHLVSRWFCAHTSPYTNNWRMMRRAYYVQPDFLRIQHGSKIALKPRSIAEKLCFFVARAFIFVCINVKAIKQRGAESGQIGKDAVGYHLSG